LDGSQMWSNCDDYHLQVKAACTTPTTYNTSVYNPHTFEIL